MAATQLKMPEPGQVIAPVAAPPGADEELLLTFDFESSPARRLQAQLQAAYAADTNPADTPYDIRLRLAIILGASVMLWAIIANVILAVI